MHHITIITTVGTSWFSNLAKAEGIPEAHQVSEQAKRKLEAQSGEAYKPTERNARNVHEAAWNFHAGYTKIGKTFRYSPETPDQPNRDASAEISSLRTIVARLPEAERQLPLKLYFLTADNGLSRAAAELVKAWWEKHATTLFPEREAREDKITIRNIRHLGVEVPEGWTPPGFGGTYYEEGLENLLKAIANPMEADEWEPESIIRLERTRPEGKNESPTSYRDNRIIVNFTGGYKAVIPILTLVAELESLEMQYLFDDSPELMTFPGMPVGLDYSLIERFYPYYLSKRVFPFDQLDDLERKDLNILVKEYHLFRRSVSENSKKPIYQRTFLGEYVYHYIERYHPEAKGTMGYMMEYKFFEFLLRNPHSLILEGKKKVYFFKIIRSVRPSYFQYLPTYQAVPEDLIRREFDLLMQAKDRSQFIVGEVKSSNLVQHGQKVLEQLQAHMEFFKILKHLPIEYHLYIYYWNNRPERKDLKRIGYTIGKLKEICHEISGGATQFKAFDTALRIKNDRFIPLSEGDKPFQKFLQARLKPNDVLPFSIS